MTDIPSLSSEASASSQPSLKIAVEGCAHGSLDTIYGSLETTCDDRGWSVAELDFLIICGDFQALRNERDMNCMSAPKRYRVMGDFHRYYSGEKKAPVLTLVIGGNHEASNYFSELSHGGWLAPNIYYMGAVNVVRYGPFRIVGLSGIYSQSDYRKPHFECLPYDRTEVRSVYHVRECDVSKLRQIRTPIDIGISHDWPRRVEWFGDYMKLFADRPHFLDSARIDQLGSPAAEQIMYLLRPKYWFSGHMHIKYTATVYYGQKLEGEMLMRSDVSTELQAQLPASMFQAPFARKNQPKRATSSTITNTTTEFLALDKPGPDREYLDLREIQLDGDAASPANEVYTQKLPNGKFDLFYDEEWLSIARSFGQKDFDPKALDDSLDWVKTNVTAKGLLRIGDHFERHAPVYDPSAQSKVGADEQPEEYPNSQTEAFCRMLGIHEEPSVAHELGDHGDGIVFG